MSNYRIDCINKPDRENTHESITHVGGPNAGGNGRWRDSVINVAQMIEQRTHAFYTQEAGATAWVGVRTSATGRKYLQTQADGVWNNNLLALKECG